MGLHLPCTMSHSSLSPAAASTRVLTVQLAGASMDRPTDIAVAKTIFVIVFVIVSVVSCVLNVFGLRPLDAVFYAVTEHIVSFG